MGEYGTPESQKAYDQAISAWLSNGRKFEPKLESAFKIKDLVDLYIKRCEKTYKPTTRKRASSTDVALSAGKYWSEFQGLTACNDYSVSDFKRFRDHLIEQSLSKRTIKSYLSYTKRMLEFGFDLEKVKPETLHHIKLVKISSYGVNSGRATEKVKPIPLVDFELALTKMKPNIAAFFRLLILTCAKSGELLQLDMSEIDKSRDVWRWSPKQHKNSHRNHNRTILFGPKSQEILSAISNAKPFISHQSVWGERMRNACKKAGIPHYHPHQIRHTAATEIAKRFGFEVASIVLGHRFGSPTTAIYVETDMSRAEDAIRQYG